MGVLASVALTVDAGRGDAGCGCPDRWECPLWCWLKWLLSLALVVEVLALVALTVDAGLGYAGRDCSERGFSSGTAALPNSVCCMWRITFGSFEGVDTSFAGRLTTPSEVFLVGLG